MNELWFTHEMNPGIVQPVQMPGLLWTGGASGDLIGVRILRSGVASGELDGKTVTGFLIRPDKQTVAISGTSAGGTVSVILPQEAYAYEGQCQLVIRVTSDGVKIPVFAGYATIGLTSTDEVIDPGSLVPDLEDLLAEIDEMETATAAAQDVVGTYESRISVAVVKSVNLYDYSKREVDKYVNPGNGAIQTAGDHDRDVSGLIDISSLAAGTYLKAQAWNTSTSTFANGPISSYAFYDANGDYLSGSSSGLPGGTVQVPEGAGYFRFTIKKDSISYAPLTTVLAQTSMFPSTYTGAWELSPDIARASDLARVEGYDNASGTVTSWADLAAAASAGGVWVLGANIKRGTNDSAITFSKDFTLYGRGYQIHCANSQSPLTVTAGVVKFIDCDIFYAYDYMITASGGSLWVSKCFLHLARQALIRGIGSALVHVDHTELAKSTHDDAFSLAEYARGFVSNCLIHECADEGITTHAFTYCEVRDTEVYHCGYFLGDSGTIDLSLRGQNSCFGGIHIGGSGMGSVIGCYSHDNLTYGIGLYHMASSHLGDKEVCYGNRCENNGYFIVSGARVPATDSAAAQAGLPICGGIMLSGCRDLDLACNTVMNNNGPGIAVGVDYYDPDKATRTPACAGTIRSNYLSGNTTNTPAVQAGADGGLTIIDI